MEVDKITQQFDNIDLHKNRVHKILAHSYLFSFILLLFGLFLDFMFPIKIFGNSAVLSIGILFLIIGTLLIFWAQRSSVGLSNDKINKETFCRGPYKYTRTPTSFGLLISMLGFGIVINALFVVIFSIISFIFSKFFFIKKEERILTLKYGEPYLEYKKSVRF